MKKRKIIGQSGIPASKIRKIFGGKRIVHGSRRSVPPSSEVPPSRKNPSSKKTVERKRHNMVRTTSNVRRVKNTPPVRQPHPARPTGEHHSPPPPILSQEVVKTYSQSDIITRMRTEALNTNRVCIINQPEKLTDIIFCEPIARLYHEKGYKIIWPVEHHLCNMNKHTEYINFINIANFNFDFSNKNFQNITGSLVVPLKYTNELIAGASSIMESRFALWNLPATTWLQSVLQRNPSAETKLFNQILQLEDGESYNLVSEYYHKDFSGYTKIVPENNLKNVYLERIANFTLIDWSKVIEEATNIYTVDNALLYWVNLLNPKSKEIHVFPKTEGILPNFDALGMSKKHIIH